MNEIVSYAEAVLGLPLPDAVVRDCLPDIAHVFLHELCHAALAGAVPWAGPDASLDPVVDEAVEVVVLVLERTLSAALGLTVPPPEEVISALASYPVTLTSDEFADLEDAWERQHQPSRDIAGFAERVLCLLRTQAAHGSSPQSGGR